MQFAILNTRMTAALGWVDADSPEEAIQKAKIKFKEHSPVVNLLANKQAFGVLEHIRSEANRLAMLDEAK